MRRLIDQTSHQGPRRRHSDRLGGLSALSGVALLLLATLAHPGSAHPGEPTAAFAEYAADRFWIISHLGQLLGFALITGGLVALSVRIRADTAGFYAALGGCGALASLSLAGVLQAVDGVALKLMVDRWAKASPETEALFFEGAYAVRQVEVGLASITLLFLAITVLLYANAMRLYKEAPRLIGWLGLASGAALAVTGLLYAYTGFSDLSMAAGMPGMVLYGLWVVLVGFFLLRGTNATTGFRPGSRRMANSRLRQAKR